MIAVITASDHGHQLDLPVRMGMYVGEEGVGGSFIVGKGMGYCRENNGEGERRLLCCML